MNGFGNNRLITLLGAAFLCLCKHMVTLSFQTAIIGRYRAWMPGYFGLLCNGSMSTWWHLKILIIPIPCDINGQLRQKVNASCRCSK